ncbi:aspartate aminotransferase family protein [Neokomagataea tanensis]|uniref:Aspartate aminotransferase family protein n=1 Tax=Neokomagataea tanensis TaxID=661191 RepID=A0A4Y6V7A4_9PROT|nr:MULTISPECIES: aspartate aminotransferase family protein [Neokomagataea]QDH24377.1 aspartate aminotransferase family protein [Neokomagataea tanensis]
MSHIFPRSCHGSRPVAVSGDGCFIIDQSGKCYFDGSGGAAVSCLGHSNPHVVEAIKEQLDSLAYAHTRFFTSLPAEELASLLIAHAPEGLEKVYLVSGGSEAVESAIKLARQYHVERGEPQRRHVIARRQSYHGNTLGALAVGGNEWRRAQYAPLLVDVSHIAPCYEYMDRSADETVEDYGLRVANELEAEILRLGKDAVMAFIAEPVVGATLGAVPAVPGYFKRIREICNQYGVLLILDEVMCGMGRTGYLYACEADEVSPDILCIAKGLGAGFQPIGAMLCTGAVYDTIAKGSGFFQHGHTYLGHPVAAAAGRAVLKNIIDRDLVSQVRERGRFLERKLRERFAAHPYVGDIRGRGLFWGIEFVQDRMGKEPFPPEVNLANRLQKVAFEAGLLCYPMSGTRDGKNGDHMLLAPPFIASEAELLGMVDMLEKAINSVLAPQTSKV